MLVNNGGSKNDNSLTIIFEENIENLSNLNIWNETGFVTKCSSVLGPTPYYS